MRKPYEKPTDTMYGGYNPYPLMRWIFGNPQIIWSQITQAIFDRDQLLDPT